MPLLAELTLSFVAAAVGVVGSLFTPLLTPPLELGWLRMGEKGGQVGRGDGVSSVLCGQRKVTLII